MCAAVSGHANAFRSLQVEMFKAYMRHAKLGPAVRARVMSYMSFLWETSKGLDERELLGNLPPRLQDEIRVSTHQVRMHHIC